MDVLRIRSSLSRCVGIGSFFIASVFLYAQNLSQIPRIQPAELCVSSQLPKAIRFQEDVKRPNLVPFEGRKNKNSMEKAAGYLVYLSKRGYKSNRPYYQLKLGQFLLDLGRDACAHQTLYKFLNTGTQLYNTDIIDAPKTYDGLFRLALLTEMRILARNGNHAELDQFSGRMHPRNGYEHLLFAEICMLSGNEDSAHVHLEKACTNPDNHPEANWGASFIPMRASVMAYCMGESDFSKTCGEDLHKRGRNAEKWPQWQSAWRMINETLMLNKQSMPDFSKLKNGNYQGACVGFLDTLVVEITITGESLKRIQVVRGKEDRPYSALEIIPQRIQSRHSLTVDCVTGATVTSSAIILAAAKAITKSNASFIK